jgi:hypothetical protein
MQTRPRERLRSLSVRPELRSSQRGSVRTRNASCTPGLVQARARRAFAPQSPIPGGAICLFLPCRTPRRARQKARICRRVLMARGGLEPPTPRFSVVRSKRSNTGEFPANKPIYVSGALESDVRKFHSFTADSGDEGRLISQSDAASRKVRADVEARSRPGRAGSLIRTARRRSRASRHCGAATRGSRRECGCPRRADC